MKTRKNIKYLIWMMTAAFFFLSVCNSHSGMNKVNQSIENANEPFDDEKIIEAVLLIPVNTVIVKEKYQGGFFNTETRKDKMERFQCSRCHNHKEVTGERSAEIAHGDIKIVHGGKEKPLSCFTCHKKDERDFLITENETKVDMDHSYQLCGKCHFRQEKDWIGGAHGKRVSFWAGKRVVKNCTSCHDPHAPLFQKQWPKTYSRPLQER